MESSDITPPGREAGGSRRGLRQRRGQQPAVPLKDVRVRAGSEEHEYEFKVRHIRRFIDEGYRVRVEVRAGGDDPPGTGSESALLERVGTELKDVAKVESEPDSAGGTPTMILTPLER